MTEYNWHNIAMVAYEKYAEQMGFPSWWTLDEDEKKAWELAIQEACKVYVAAALA